MSAPNLRMALSALLLALGVFGALHGEAVIETYRFSSPALEQRYHQLSQELRCPKCQNQNIADSNAPIAQDLRRLVFEQLEAGASDRQILDDMVARYGEFVRYRPDARGVTLWLWLTPALLLLAGVILLLLLLRRGHDNAPRAVTDDERHRLDALLLDEGDQR